MFSFFEEYKTAQHLVEQEFDVIFYAENAFYFQYFYHLFEGLCERKDIRIAYITSEKEDPVLLDKRVEGYYLKSTLAGVFSRLRSKIMIMTMPDLENFIFRRSDKVDKYVYVFHALVSTHLQYRLHAFDHFDAILCTGPQQMEEIRSSEKLYGLPAKELIPYGYPFLNNLKSRVVPERNKILIAPTWYAEGVLKTCLLSLLEILSATSYQICLRPHPEFIKREKKTWRKLSKMVKTKNIIIDTAPSVYTHLSDAAVLITDRSGIAFEFSFSSRRPVIFIDTPLKMQNPDWKKIHLEPVENQFRYEIGTGVAVEDLNLLPEIIKKVSSGHDLKHDYAAAENKMVFDSSHHANGINYLLNFLNSYSS